MQPIIDSRDAGFQVIPVTDLTAKHRVVDVYGGGHAVKSVRHLKDSIKVTRDDGWIDYFARTDVVTVEEV